MQIKGLSWAQVEAGVRGLANQLRGKKIWGIPRGGQLVATLLAYHGCVLVPHPFQAEVFIDDIVCTGATLKELRACHMRQEFAVLVYRVSNCVEPDYFAYKFDVEEYILFPWEDRATAEELAASGCFTDQDLNTRLGKRKTDV